MNQNISNEFNITEAPEQGENVVVYELLAELGYEQSDFEPEEWANLVDYYKTLAAEGEDLEGLLPDLDIATAAGPTPQWGAGAQPLVLGMQQSIPDAAAFVGNSEEDREPQQRPESRSEVPSDDEDILDEQDTLEVDEPEVPPTFVVGTPDADLLVGDEYRDVITPDAGNDTLLGGDGDDTFHFSTNLNVKDIVDGGDGYDVLTFTDGNRNARNELNSVINVEKLVLGDAVTKVTTVDTLVADGATLEVDGSNVGNKSVTFDGRAETDGSFDITTASGKDYLYGGDGNDTFHAGDNADRLYGYDGDDSLFGEGGNDRLTAGDGADTLHGGAGNDKLYGQDGNDSMIGGSGKDQMFGGNDNDWLDGGTEADTIKGDAGNDTLLGGDGSDRLHGGADDDSLAGGEGNDRLYGNDGVDTLSGDAGNDKLYGNDGNDSMSGGSGKDQMYGGNDNDQMFGGSENDIVKGENGNDTLFGDSGNDKLYGGSGNDLLVGGTGTDSLYGNAGSDTFRYNSMDETGDKVYNFRTVDDVFEFASDTFDSSADFVAGNIKGYDGTNASLGHNNASFIFDDKTNKLWYDDNGDDIGGETLIATISGDDVSVDDIDFV